VQLYWAYYALPLLHVHIGAVTAAVLVLGLNEGSYSSEIVRGGVNSVPRGQFDAAVAVGFSPWHRFTRVVLPQALPLMAPGFGNTVVTMVKFTSLVSLVTIPDVAFRAKSIEASINQPTAIYGVVLVIYFVICLVFALLMRLLESYLRRRYGVPRLAAGVRVRRRTSLPLPAFAQARAGD
jgi:polar amino acid transport system permease protein